MKLIVGLGNPGKEYVGTRHNVGFDLLDSIARKYDVSFNKNKFNGDYAEISISGEKIILLKPLSFMNLSGSVVSKFVSYYRINFDDILIIIYSELDDIVFDFCFLSLVQLMSKYNHK